MIGQICTNLATHFLARDSVKCPKRLFILLLLGFNRGESGHICLSYKVDVSSLVRQLSCSSGGFCGAIMFVCNTFQDNKESDRTGGKVIHTF